MVTGAVAGPRVIVGSTLTGGWDSAEQPEVHAASVIAATTHARLTGRARDARRLCRRDRTRSGVRLGYAARPSSRDVMM